MSAHKSPSSLATIGFAIGGILLLALWLYFLFFRPKGRIEVLVPAPEKFGFNSAVLSPQQDKLLYVESATTNLFFLNLVTNETHQIKQDCSTHAWIDNNTIACHWDRTLVDVRDGSTRTVQTINYHDQPVDLAELITENHQVYELKDWPGPRVLLVVADEPQVSYYLHLVPEDAPLPPDTVITVIPPRLELVIDRVSPNGEYYFRRSSKEWLHIYDRHDQLVAQVRFWNVSALCANM
ncbi:MAG: hypothetical protein H0T73_16715 [Ardenticatenales bacterium]|nr:hypothetical protein [Ardenticatenales bacterium]